MSEKISENMEWNRKMEEARKQKERIEARMPSSVICGEVEDGETGKRLMDDEEWEKWKGAMEKYFNSEDGRVIMEKITGEISRRVRKQLIKEIGEGKLVKDEECKYCTYTIENGERTIYKHCKECRKELEYLKKGEEINGRGKGGKGKSDESK